MDTIRIADLPQETTTGNHLKIEVPVEEELLAAVECALEWFEDWSKHADHDHDFGGEHRVMQKLRRALAEVWIREEL